MQREPVLEVKGVDFSYVDGTKALCDINLSIPVGKRIAFLGPNGAGKTTLFLHFNGLIKPDRGRVYFAGREVQYSHAALLELRKKVGIVFQDPDTQLFSSTVRQEISFGPINLGLTKKDVIERVTQAMTYTGILDLQEKPTHFLSYGQKKRVAIADILAMQPQVLICDEPTAWLDTKHAAQIMGIFEKINNQGVTIIFSTHDVDLAYSWADYIFLMKDGRLIGEGEPGLIFSDENILKGAELQKPLLMELYEELERKGWMDSQVKPKNKDALLRGIINRPGQ